MILHACWACGGSGHHLKSASPLRFKPCWCCNGGRGRTSGPPTPNLTYTWPLAKKLRRKLRLWEHRATTDPD